MNVCPTPQPLLDTLPVAVGLAVIVALIVAIVVHDLVTGGQS